MAAFSTSRAENLFPARRGSQQIPTPSSPRLTPPQHPGCYPGWGGVPALSTPHLLLLVPLSGGLCLLRLPAVERGQGWEEEEAQASVALPAHNDWVMVTPGLH